MNGECVSTKRRRKDCCTKDRLFGLSMFLSVCLLLSVVCLAFFSYFLFVGTNESGYCTDPQCIRSAAEIIGFVDSDIDPCADFHAFVCDKFMKTAYEQQLNNPLSAELDTVENKIDKYIIEPDVKGEDQLVIAQKRYFQACFKEENTNQKNRIFVGMLDQIGGWPILKKGDWKEQDFHWMQTMINARRIGLPFDWFIDIDLYDTGSYYYLKISRPKDCENLKGHPDNDYTTLILHIIRDFIGPDVQLVKVTDITKFENNLSQICAQIKNEIFRRAHISELQNYTKNSLGNITWIKFIDDISGKNRHWQLSSDIFYDHHYLLALTRLLERTNKEIQANYIGWKIAQYFAPYLSQSIRKEYQNFTNKYTDRFQFCLADTKSWFHPVSEIMYIREITNPEIVEAGINLVSSIKTELVDEIKNIEWMNNQTKKDHLNVYEKLETTIGVPQEIFDEDFFSHFPDIDQLRYRDYDIIRMLCDWSLTKFAAKMAQIGKESKLSFNFENIESTDLVLNKEELYLPARLLHGSTFDLNRPYYLNYASLGTLIARKLVEDIIATSGKYLRHYVGNQQCLVKSKSFAPHSDALFIYIELLSRHLAYNAYQKYVEENGEELELPGVPYSPNQLFWIKSSMNLCYKKLPNESDGNNMTSLLEAMYKNSIVQSVKNSPFFGEDFGCEEDTPMNPSQKCSIF